MNCQKEKKKSNYEIMKHVLAMRNIVAQNPQNPRGFRGLGDCVVMAHNLWAILMTFGQRPR